VQLRQTSFGRSPHVKATFKPLRLAPNVSAARPYREMPVEPVAVPRIPHLGMARFHDFENPGISGVTRKAVTFQLSRSSERGVAP